MWSSFTSLRLGTRLSPLDWIVIAAILLLVPPVLLSRESLADAGSPLALMRYLQFASPLLLALPASVGVVLYRVSRQMGEGMMAVTLRCFAASFAIRLLALMVSANSPRDPESTLVFWVIQTVSSVSAHWIFLLGLAYRSSFSRATADLIRKYVSGEASAFNRP